MSRSEQPCPVARQLAAACIGGRVRILNRVVSGIFDRRLRPFGLRCSQMNILTVIAAKGPLSPGDACQFLSLDKSTLSRDLDRVVERGWIGTTPGPGRSQILEITAAGREMIRQVQPAWDEAQAETLAYLGEDLARELCRIVDQGGAAGRGPPDVPAD